MSSSFRESQDWRRSQLTERLGISLPIIQAPMAGGPTTPELVAAVSNAGGLGSLGAGYLKPEEIRAAIRKIRSLTTQPFAINLFIPGPVHDNPDSTEKMVKYLNSSLPAEGLVVTPATVPTLETWQREFSAQMDVLMEENIPIFSFTFGCPSSEVIERLHRRDIKVMGTATTAKEAVLLQQAGVDAIVVQGSEAGGHRGTFITQAENISMTGNEADSRNQASRTNGAPLLIGLMALLPQVADAVQVPLVASGGIMNGRGIAASLALGASAVQLGTAFLVTDESGAHRSYKEALLSCDPESTVVTRAFSGKWARGIRNTFVEVTEAYRGDIPDYPIQNTLTRGTRNWAQKTENKEYMSLWAGQGVHLSRQMSAQKLVLVLTAETDAVFNQLMK